MLFIDIQTLKKYVLNDRRDGTCPIPDFLSPSEKECSKIFASHRLFKIDSVDCVLSFDIMKKVILNEKVLYKSLQSDGKLLRRH